MNQKQQRDADDENRRRRRSEVLEMIEVGLAEARRGDTVDGERFMEQLRQRHRERVRRTDVRP